MLQGEGRSFCRLNPIAIIYSLSCSGERLIEKIQRDRFCREAIAELLSLTVIGVAGILRVNPEEFTALILHSHQPTKTGIFFFE